MSVRAVFCLVAAAIVLAAVMVAAIVTVLMIVVIAVGFGAGDQLACDELTDGFVSVALDAAQDADARSVQRSLCAAADAAADEARSAICCPLRPRRVAPATGFCRRILPLSIVSEYSYLTLTR